MAANMMASNPVAHECQHKCNSQKHASGLTAALTRSSLTDEEVAAYLKWCCVRYSKSVDLCGRTLLHLAASVGRPKLLVYLLKHRGVNINEKDKESHFTPLHRSLFYGNIDCAVRLIQHGANIDQPDLDNLIPFDLVIEDSLASYNSEYMHCWEKNYEVYVWGSNTNYTLGIGNHQSRAYPEILECFRRRNIPIVEVFMSKFHSAFLDSNGSLQTCGHGQGGRLGLGNESTTLTPNCVPGLGEVHMVALGTYHTIVLKKEVYSFGLNTYHQLGHSPPPDKLLSPKEINAHNFKGVVVGIKASKYHSAFWTQTKLFTCGLNGGQLGHSKSSANTIIVPKAVPINRNISLVASGDYAMVLATDSADTYLLYNYKVQKIKLGSFYPKMIEVRGGRLDHEFSSEVLVDKGGDLLQILLIATNNNIYIWQENGKGCFQCDTGLRRKIDITNVAINRNSVLFVFANGMAFEGEIKTSQRKSNSGSNRQSHSEPLRGHIKLKRIPYLHRVKKIACDIDGRNFAAVRTSPKGRYWGTVRETLAEDMKKVFDNLETSDYFQDVTFEVGGHRYSAHRYVVAYSSKVLEGMMSKEFESKGVCVVKIKNMKPETFSKLLNFMYTGNCCFCDQSTSLKCSFCELDYNLSSSAHYYYVKVSSALNLLRSGADRFKIEDLQNILRDQVPFQRYRQFERNALSYLQDVTIKSADGVEYRAHKVMLASRSEYFNVFISRWLDIAGEGKMNLSVPGKVVKVLLNYIYTDKSEGIEEADDDFLISTYNAANQYLCYGFRDYISNFLAQMLSLENASKIFHLASIYDDKSLKISCMSFICSDLTAFLEYRSLENLPDSVLAELSEYYKKTCLPSGYRQITPYYDAPDDKLVGLIAKTEPVSLDSIEEELPVKSVSKTPKKKNRKSGRTRNASSSSFTSEEEPEPLEIIDFDDLNDKDEEESWVKVSLKKVVNRPPRQLPKNVQTNVRTPVDPSKVLDSPPEEDKFVTLNRAPDSGAVQNLGRKFCQLNTSSEEEFPALDASPVQKTVCSNPQTTPGSSPKVFEKIVKLSQKQRKRLSAKSGREEESVEKNEIKSPWGVSKIETQQLADIMKEESRGSSGNQRRVVWNPPWQSMEKPESSLTEVMESEKKRYELFKRKRAIEDRAMEDLLLLYDAKNVTSERITVMRANQDLVFLPF